MHLHVYIYLIPPPLTSSFSLLQSSPMYSGQRHVHVHNDNMKIILGSVRCDPSRPCTRLPPRAGSVRQNRRLPWAPQGQCCHSTPWGTGQGTVRWRWLVARKIRLANTLPKSLDRKSKNEEPPRVDLLLTGSLLDTSLADSVARKKISHNYPKQW